MFLKTHIFVKLITSSVFITTMISVSEAQNRCLNSDGTPKANAEYCKDEDANGCSKAYGPNGLPRKYNEAPAQTCTAAPATGTTLKAEQCRQTCATCCELPQYDCENHDNGEGLKCKDNVANCVPWKDLMVELCPGTCGYCLESKVSSTTNAPLNGKCRDELSNCAEYKNLCSTTQTAVRDMLIKNCAATCGLCEEKSKTVTGVSRDDTADLASNCAVNSHLCNKNLYRDLMNELCRGTCDTTLQDNVAGVLRVATATCYDSNDQCKTWYSNGFCDSGFYTSAKKQEKCALSCGYC